MGAKESLGLTPEGVSLYMGRDVSPVQLAPPSPFSSASVSFQCSNPIYGQTLNPLTLKKTPGGSSGGEGAMLAQGGSILGMGTDTAGSIRIPATFCGICGFRTTGYRLRYLVLMIGGGVGLTQPGGIEVWGNRGDCLAHQLLSTHLRTRGSG